MNIEDLINNLNIEQMDTKDNLKKDILFLKPLKENEYQHLNEINEIDTIIKDNEEDHYFEYGTPIKH